MAQSVDPLHARILARIEELGTSAHAVSKAIGGDKSYLRKLFEKPGRRPGADKLQALAKELQWTTAQLMGEGDETRDGPQFENPEEPVRALVSAPPVPVRGTVAGSHESGAFQFDGSDIEYIERFPALLRRPKVYGLYVEGDSMSPQHNSGEIRFVDPAEPVRVNDTVVVTVKDPDRGLYAVLGHLKRRGDTIVIGKLNPEREISFHRLMVHTIHHVLTPNELAGLG